MISALLEGEDTFFKHLHDALRQSCFNKTLTFNMFLFLLLTRFQGTLPSSTMSCSSLEAMSASESGSKHFEISSFAHPLTWTRIYKISHLFSLFSPLRVSPSCFHILPSLEPLSLLLFLWNPCLILGSGVDSRAYTAGLGCLFPRIDVSFYAWLLYYFLPPFVSCMVFGVCAETFIFQQLTLS